MNQRDILAAGWRRVDTLLAASIPVHARRLEIEQLIADLRTAEMLECSGKLDAMQLRIDIALAGTEQEARG